MLCLTIAIVIVAIVARQRRRKAEAAAGEQRAVRQTGQGQHKTVRRKRLRKADVEEVIVTDTVPLSPAGQACGKIVVLSVARLLGQAIKNIHDETSVSSLFV